MLDIFVPYSSDSQRERTWKGVALELYGKQHLTVNTQRITGKMVLRQRLLEVNVIPLIGIQSMSVQGMLVHSDSS